MTTDVELNTTKAKNIIQEVRTKRMNEVMVDFKEVGLQMSLYKKQRLRQTNVQQYSQAIILTASTRLNCDKRRGKFKMSLLIYSVKMPNQ